MSRKNTDVKYKNPTPYPKIRDIPPEAWKKKEWPITELEFPEEEKTIERKDRNGKMAAAGEEMDDF